MKKLSIPLSFDTLISNFDTRRGEMPENAIFVSGENQTFFILLPLPKAGPGGARETI